jgi:hypothetical protein
MLKILEKRVGKVSFLAILATMLVVTLTVPALAAVTFDPATGTGFVGKGDVQTPFNLNNAQLQSALINNPQAVTFTYIKTDTYQVTNVWETGLDSNSPSKSYNVHDEIVTTTTGVNSAINGDPRQMKGQNQFTGFNLKGFGTSSVTGTVPEPDVTYGSYDVIYYPNGPNKPSAEYTAQDVPLNANGQPYTAENKGVDSVSLISSTGGLYANYGGNTVLLQSV